MNIRQTIKQCIYTMLGTYFIIGQVLTNNILNIALQTIEVWNSQRHWTVILRSYIKHCFIFLFLLHLLPAALAYQQPHDFLSSHHAPQVVCDHLLSNIQHHDLLDLQHQGSNLCHHSLVNLHQLAFPLHTQHLLCHHSLVIVNIS